MQRRFWLVDGTVRTVMYCDDGESRTQLVISALQVVEMECLDRIYPVCKFSLVPGQDKSCLIVFARECLSALSSYGGTSAMPLQSVIELNNFPVTVVDISTASKSGCVSL